uniref:Uncharacterized protein n=1 Tax=Rhizophora mucronata TaxID=61149 RepID=A0A2P2PJU8_RHIMU
MKNNCSNHMSCVPYTKRRQIVIAGYFYARTALEIRCKINPKKIVSFLCNHK